MEDFLKPPSQTINLITSENIPKRMIPLQKSSKTLVRKLINEEKNFQSNAFLTPTKDEFSDSLKPITLLIPQVAQVAHLSSKKGETFKSRTDMKIPQIKANNKNSVRIASKVTSNDSEIRMRRQNRLRTSAGYKLRRKNFQRSNQKPLHDGSKKKAICINIRKSKKKAQKPDYNKIPYFFYPYRKELLADNKDRMSFSDSSDHPFEKWTRITNLIIDKNKKGFNLLCDTLQNKPVFQKIKKRKSKNSAAKKYDSDKMKSHLKSRQASNSYGKTNRLRGDSLSKRLKLSTMYGLEVKEKSNFGIGMVSVKQSPGLPMTKRGSFKPTEAMSIMNASMNVDKTPLEKEIRLRVSAVGLEKLPGVEEEEKNILISKLEESDNVLADSVSSQTELSINLKIKVCEPDKYFQQESTLNNKKSASLTDPSERLTKMEKHINSQEGDSPDVDSPEVEFLEADSAKDEEDNYLTVERTKFHRNRSKSTKIQMSKSNDNLNYIKDNMDKVSTNEKNVKQTSKNLKKFKWYNKGRSFTKRKARMGKHIKAVKHKHKKQIKRKLTRASTIKHKNLDLVPVIRKMSFDAPKNFDKLQLQKEIVKKSKRPLKRLTKKPSNLVPFPISKLSSNIQFFSRDYKNQNLAGANFLQMISKPVRFGSKEGSSYKPSSTRRSEFSNRLKFKNSMSSNRLYSATLNVENSESFPINKGMYATKNKIKDKLDKNTKTSYTRKAGKYSEILRIIKSKLFSVVRNSPPLCKPLVSLVIKEKEGKLAKRKLSLQEDRKKIIKKVSKALQQNSKYTYKKLSTEIMQKKTTFDSSLLGQDLKPPCLERPIEKNQKKKTHLRPKTGGRDPHLRMIQKLKSHCSSTMPERIKSKLNSKITKRTRPEDLYSTPIKKILPQKDQTLIFKEQPKTKIRIKKKVAKKRKVNTSINTPPEIPEIKFKIVPKRVFSADQQRPPQREVARNNFINIESKCVPAECKEAKPSQRNRKYIFMNKQEFDNTFNSSQDKADPTQNNQGAQSITHQHKNKKPTLNPKNTKHNILVSKTIRNQKQNRMATKCLMPKRPVKLNRKMNTQVDESVTLKKKRLFSPIIYSKNKLMDQESINEKKISDLKFASVLNNKPRVMSRNQKSVCRGYRTEKNTFSNIVDTKIASTSIYSYTYL
ncbi:unnamed protein product [Moneuplotes crassus]|uniref:Uncharacterized protein n=1 Tax=Euplotes crassus TaxID=5936 RepID=A0AAD1U4K9_EUPCR|nr:unnamed protein product [Moneuplotes crassus]